MMVTVAKSLDVPIKLMFPRPAPLDDPSASASHAMLGLGDVVLPGIMIGLALRFDLYIFYLRRQKRTAANTQGETDTVVKPQYHSLAGRWSDHFWTHSLSGRPLWTTAVTGRESQSEVPFTFPKTYFTASLIGYVLGLLATLGVMMVWNHAQPALLYLVPGVLSSIWLTALVRGELDLMWNYTEEIDDEEKSKTTPSGQQVENTKRKEQMPRDVSAKNKGDERPTEVKHVAGHRPVREVFSFSIEAPWQLKQPRSIREEHRHVPQADLSPQLNNEKHNWVSSKAAADTEPTGKRMRLR
jgi:minor histocompatibility antigen H13